MVRSIPTWACRCWTFCSRCGASWSAQRIASSWTAPTPRSSLRPVELESRPRSSAGAQRPQGQELHAGLPLQRDEGPHQASRPGRLAAKRLGEVHQRREGLALGLLPAAAARHAGSVAGGPSGRGARGARDRGPLGDRSRWLPRMSWSSWRMCRKQMPLGTTFRPGCAWIF